MHKETDALADLQTNLVRLKQQCTEIGEAPPRPPTLRGAVGAFLVTTVRRSLSWYTGSVRNAIEALRETLEGLIRGVVVLEEQVQQQGQSSKRSERKLAGMESQLQLQAEALERSQEALQRSQQVLEQVRQESQRQFAEMAARLQEQEGKLQQLERTREVQDLQLDLEPAGTPATVLPGSWFRIPIRLRNRSTIDVASPASNPLRLAYHCYSESMDVIVFDGHRTRLPTLRAGAVTELNMEVLAPRAEGKFLFRLTLVQEGVQWFDTPPNNLLWDAWIRVANPQPLPAIGLTKPEEAPPLVSRRLLLTSTPRSGNTWLRLMLRDALGIVERDVDTPSELDWQSMPDGFVVQMHWRRNAEILELLGRFEIQPVTIIRHPLDVLISILHFSTFEERTVRWLDGEGGSEERINGLSPTDREFLDYALGTRAEALLSVSKEWLEAGCPFIRYENLVADPVATLRPLLREQHLAMTVEKVVEDCRIENLRGRARNSHFWRAQPGLWRSLVSASWAEQIQVRHSEIFRSLGYGIEGAIELRPSEILATWMQF